MEKEGDFKYYAFISYSSKDLKYAKELWKKLERYRLPSFLYKHYKDKPNKFHIFLDQGDIVPGDTVENALRRELIDSKKLIVICSPNSAYSKYVELEVQSFLKFGHSKKDIIPYIINGEIQKSSPNNCYVPSLFGNDDKENVNGVSVVRDGKWKAFVGVIASLLDIKFDEIFRREQLRKKKNFFLRLIFLLLIVSSCCAIYLKKIHIYHEYYVDYVEKAVQKENGTDIEFIGLGKLSKKNIKKRGRHYNFNYRDGKLRKIVYENSFGVPKRINDLEIIDRPMIQEMEYNETTGYLQAILSKNEYNSILTKFVYEQNGLAIDLKNADGTPLSFISESVHYNAKDLYNDIGITKHLSNIKSYKYERDKNGFIIKKMFFKANGAEYPSKDKDNIAGFEYTLDDLGRPVVIWFLGIKNNEFERQCSNNGIAGYALEYDDNFNICKKINIDSEGKPIGLSGISTKIYEYDENGNQIKESFHNTDGELCYNSKEHTSYRLSKYDDYGNLIGISYYDEQNKISLNNDFYAYVTYKYDKKGNCINSYFYDENGKLCNSREGYSISQQKYNSKNKVIEDMFFDNNMKLTLYNNKFAKFRLEYNTNGDLKSVKYFNEYNAPYILNELTQSVFIYDDFHRIKEVIYYDTTNKINKIHKFEYDRIGNCILEYWCDDRKRPIDDSNGICYTKKTYDDSGNLMEITYSNIKNDLITNNDGYAGITFTYDEFGNTKTLSFFNDFEKTLCDTSFGYAYIEFRYDDRGNRIYEKQYNSKKEPMLPYCIIRTEYDNNNNLINESYYNDNNELADCKNGYAQIHREYNKYGQQTKIQFLDKNKNLYLWNNEYSIVTYKYDIYERITELAFYDEKGNLGRYIEQEYDTKGNKTKLAKYNNKNELENNIDGFAIIRTEYYNNRKRKKEMLYDENEVLIRETYFNNYGEVEREIPYPKES